MRGVVIRSVVFTTIMIAKLMVQLLNLVVASLDKMLHDNYLCLVESDKLQIKEDRSKNSTGKLGNEDNSQARLDSPHVVYCAFIAFSRQEDKDEEINQRNQINAGSRAANLNSIVFAELELEK